MFNYNALLIRINLITVNIVCLIISYSCTKVGFVNLSLQKINLYLLANWFANLLIILEILFVVKLKILLLIQK
jgi:hypothetical protein